MVLYDEMRGNMEYYRDFLCRSVAVAYVVGGGTLSQCDIDEYLSGGRMLRGSLVELQRLARVHKTHRLLMEKPLTVRLLGGACKVLGIDCSCLYIMASLDLQDILGVVEAQQGMLRYDASLAYLIGLAGSVMINLPPSVLSPPDWLDYTVALELDDLNVIHTLLSEACMVEYDIMCSFGIKEGVFDE